MEREVVILVYAEDPGLGHRVSSLLEKVSTFRTRLSWVLSPEEALRTAGADKPDIVFIQAGEGHEPGENLLERLRYVNPCVSIVLMADGQALSPELDGAVDDVLWIPLATPANLRRVITRLINSKETEDTLTQLVSQNKRLLEAAPHWIWSTDASFRITSASPAVEDILGFEPNAIIGAPLLDLMLPESADAVRHTLEHAGANGCRHLLLAYQHRQGMMRYLDSNVYPLYDHQGNVTGYTGVNRDETSRKEVEDRLRRRLRLEQLTGNVALLMLNVTEMGFDAAIQEVLRLICIDFELDRAVFMTLEGDEYTVRRALEWSRANLEPIRDRIMGVRLASLPWLFSKLAAREDIEARETAALPDDAALERELWRTLGIRGILGVPLVRDEMVMGYISLCTHTRPPIWVLPEDSLVARVIGDVILSAQARIESEREHRRIRKRIETIFNKAQDAIAILDLDGSVMEANPAAHRILGLPECTLIGAPFNAFYPGMYSQESDSFENRLRIYGGVFDSVTVTRPDGFQSPVDLMATLVPWNGAEAVMITMRDVSEREQMNARLKRLATAVDQAFDSVVITDTQGLIQYVNPSFERVTGYTVQEVLGHGMSMLKSGEHVQSFYESMWATIASGEVWRGCLANRKKDGARFLEETTISPVINEQGVITNYVAVKQDVTKQIELERHLRQAQKLEAIGTLAGGIAHDFNNILSPMLGYADLMLSDAPEASKSRQYLSEIVTAGQRARELVRQILTFSRQMEQEWQPLHIGLVVSEALKLLRASLPATINIQTELHPECGLVMGDATQIHQIVMNLATNAFHAMKDTGGCLIVKLHPVSFSEPFTGFASHADSGDYIELSVTDTGAGMNPEVLEYIFMPFFTTKGPGEGSGMGLCTVHGIVSSHRGVIQVESDVGKGSVFRVFLPCTAGDNGPSSGEPETIHEWRGHILVVDDEAQVANLVGCMLEKLGYDASCMTSSTEALALFQRDPRKFQAVITDQTMPKLTGVRLAEAIRGITPTMPVVLMSGYSDSIRAENEPERWIDDFIHKPILMRELAQALDKAFGKHAIMGGEQQFEQH